MSTLVAFVAALAVIVGFSVAVSRWLPLRHSFGAAAAWIGAPLVAVIRATGRFVEFAVGPASPRLNLPRLGLWVALNLLPLVLVLAFWVLAPVLARSLPTFGDPGVLLGAAALFQALVLASAVVALHESHDAMEGFAGWGTAARGPAISASPAVIAIAACLFATYGASLVYWLQHILSAGLLVRVPGTGSAIADAFLVVLWSIPTEILLRPLDWLFGVSTAPVFTHTLLGGAIPAAFYVVGFLLLAGFASAAAETLLQGRRLIAGLGRARDVDREHAVSRARVAPPTIRRGIVDAAISTTDPEVRRRLFEAARDAEILDLPDVVIRHLESFDESTQLFAVDRALELFRQRAHEFGRAPCEAMVQSGVRLIVRGRLSAESGKRVTRLLVAVLTARREVMALDDAECARLTEHINAAIQRARDDSDAAYRGLLQDLRTAIGRAAASRLPTAVPMRAGRGALPGTPPPKAPR